MGKFIQMKTELPGPKSKAIIEQKKRAVIDAMTIHVPAVIDKAEGAIVTDVDGNRFIDLSGGLGVLNVGHCHPQVVQAIKQSVERFLHTDFSVVPYESYVKLAQTVCDAAPISGPKKAVFFNSGAEAIENAVKISRFYSKRKALVAFEGAFHGRTLMCLSLTSKAKPYKMHFGPFASDVYRVAYAYCYRCPLKLSYPSCGLECADLLDRLFKLFVIPEEVAAVVIEPVQGEGGFVVPPKEYLPRIREICNKHGVLLVVDEIQTGFGRTGKLFACEHSGVEPDIMCIGKSLGAGLPISGCVGKAEVMDAPSDSSIGGTYIGNPVACDAALAVFKVMKEEDLPARAAQIGSYMKQRFESMKERYSIIGDVRGLGAMVGIEFVKDRQTKEPAPEETNAIMKKAMGRGVISVKCGLHGNVIRMLVPLVITDDQLEEALDVLEQCIAEVNAGK
ncbi:MAG: 4-aminobutyrate--2-oxoglutarate transaminase [Bacillota bacterium]